MHSLLNVEVLMGVLRTALEKEISDIEIERKERLYGDHSLKRSQE